MTKKRPKTSASWDGSERLFENTAWRDRFGLKVFKEMKPEMQPDFIRGMIAEGLEVEGLPEGEIYSAALAYARAHSRNEGGGLLTQFSSGFYVEYPENRPVWFSRECIVDGLRIAQAKRVIEL